MFGPFVLVFVALSVIAIDEGDKRSSWYCSSIRHRACYPYGEHLMCGTDNYTYYNRCEFTKSHCLNNHIHVVHEGSCNGQSHLTSNLTSGELLLLQFMCEDITGHRCEEEYDQVCGSNGVTYMNESNYSCNKLAVGVVGRGVSDELPRFRPATKPDYRLTIVFVRSIDMMYKV